MQHNRLSSHVICTIFTFLCIVSQASSEAPSTNCKPTRNFIKSECNTTYFSNLCYIFLSPYACKIHIDRQWLTSAALDATANTSNNVLKLLVMLSKQGGVKDNMTEAATISGCASDIAHVLDDIRIASHAMANKMINTTIRLANKQQALAYIGYAVANDKRCLKRLSNGRIRDSLKMKISGAVSTALKLKAISQTFVTRI